MWKNRYIDTHFWKDNYIVELDPSEKLLFLYLLSNPHANIAWIYEISIREISFDTWFDKDLILRLLDRFSKDNKIHYIQWYIYLVNSIKHQKINPSIKKWIEIIVKSIKSDFWQELAKNDKLYTGCIQALTYININYNNNININSNEDLEKSSPKDETSSSLWKKEEIFFKDLLKENFKEDFIKKIKEKYEISPGELKVEVELFIIHWTEKNPGWRKEKWQMQKTFDIQKRFYTWMANNRKWNTPKNKTQNTWVVLVDDF